MKALAQWTTIWGLMSDWLFPRLPRNWASIPILYLQESGRSFTPSARHDTVKARATGWFSTHARAYARTGAFLPRVFCAR